MKLSEINILLESGLLKDKVILMFDDDDSGHIVARILRSRLGCHIEHCDNATVALEHLEGGLKPDLLITDIAVEKPMSELYSYRTNLGEDIAKKARELYPDIPIITMSGWPERPEYSICHFRKPIDTNGVVQKIKQLLGVQE